jgi:integrase
MKRTTCVFSFLIFFLFCFQAVLAQDVVEFFKKNCTSCHTIGGGPLTGPDLKNVTQRQEREWLVKWLLDPEGVLKSGDPYAVKLQKESRGAVMRNIPGMTPELANALLDLIAAESKKEKSQFAGMSISQRPFLPEDIVEGREIFMGTKRLKNGGPPCISCHHVNSIDNILGGGKLGPNLTRAFARLKGRKGLSSWLLNPPSVVMAPIFSKKPLTEDEILALVAFLKNETEKDTTPSSAFILNFILLGVGLGLIFLVLFDVIWGFRFGEVRKSIFIESYKHWLNKKVLS